MGLGVGLDGGVSGDSFEVGFVSGEGDVLVCCVGEAGVVGAEENCLGRRGDG